MALQSKNPATLEVVKTFDEISEEQLEAKIANAHSAFASWKLTSFEERKKLMLNLAKYLREHSDELSKLQSIEMGKVISSGPAGIEKCAVLCEYYANTAESGLSNEVLAGFEKGERYVAFDPLGVVLSVMPWNFPFWQVYRFAVPALMAGNVGLLKHASNVPQCAEMIEQTFREAGFPEGVFQNLLIGSARVERVIRDKRVMAVAITGSEKAGADVARIAGEEIKKCVLELGGSDPFIVFSDVDVPAVAAVAVSARFENNVGQTCIAPKRFIVHSSIVEKFTQEVVAQAAKLSIGDPMLPETQVGPLATESILTGVEQQVNDSVAKGAILACGGKRAKETGYFYTPTVLTNVTKGMPAYDEEVFGPVIAIIAFETEEQAIQIANDTPYGLGASLWTKDIAHAKTLVSKIDAGNVFVNAIVRSDVRAPFGGIKRSGFGRELGTYGIKEFVNIKNVSLE